MNTCPHCERPMFLADIRLLASPGAGNEHPKNGGAVTGAVKVFACTGRVCELVEQRTGSGNCELPAP